MPLSLHLTQSQCRPSLRLKGCCQLLPTALNTLRATRLGRAALHCVVLPLGRLTTADHDDKAVLALLSFQLLATSAPELTLLGVGVLGQYRRVDSHGDSASVVATIRLASVMRCLRQPQVVASRAALRR